MAKKTLEQCKTHQDFVRYAKKNGATVEQCKKGVKIYNGDSAQYAVIHSNHRKDMATGTRSALIKAFLAIGLAAIPACWWITQLQGVM
jgi:hypothetical protein